MILVHHSVSCSAQPLEWLIKVEAQRSDSRGRHTYSMTRNADSVSHELAMLNSHNCIIDTPSSLEASCSTKANIE